MVKILLLLLITTVTDPHSPVTVWIQFQRGDLNCAWTQNAQTIGSSECGLLNQL